MYDFILQRFSQKEQDAAVGFLHRKFNFSRLKAEIDRCACALVKFGIKKGDTITLALPNIPSALSLFYGANKLGIVINFVHPLLPYCQLRDNMNKTGSKTLFALDAILDKYFNEAISDNIRIVSCTSEQWLSRLEKFFYVRLIKKRFSHTSKHDKITAIDDFLNVESFETETDNSFDETRVIMHSGGTGSLPKSVMLTNLNFNANAYNVAAVYPTGREGLGKGDAIMAILPMYHAFGFGVQIHAALFTGYQTLLIPAYNLKAIVKKIRRDKSIKMLAGVPTMFDGILNTKGFEGKHLKKLKTAFCGGDRLSEKTKIKFDSVLQKHHSACTLDAGYGMTEVVGALSVNTKKQYRAGSVGKPLGGGCVVEAFDFETDKLLNRGTYGQLCMCGDAVMKGYLGEENDSGFFFIKEKKFVKSGDLGMVDEDGFIFFKSRIKRVVKVSGISVFPAEAEKVIQSLPGVRDCCVVPKEHQYKGCALFAFIVLEERENSIEVLKCIREECKVKLDKWTLPKGYAFLEKLPLTGMGKPDSKKLEEIAISYSFD